MVERTNLSFDGGVGILVEFYRENVRGIQTNVMYLMEIIQLEPIYDLPLLVFSQLSCINATKYGVHDCVLFTYQLISLISHICCL